MKDTGAEVIRSANLAYQLGGDAALLRTLGGGADALVLVEARDGDERPVDVDKILNPPGRRPDWRVWQNLADSARSGTVIAVRRRRAGGVLRVRKVAGVVSKLLRLSRPGRRVQSRYLRSLKLRGPISGRFTLAGAHIPLESSDRQDEAVEALRLWWKRTRGRKLALGDGNMDHARLRRRVGAAFSAGRDVVFALWSHGWGDPRVTSSHEQGSDHAVLTFIRRLTRRTR